jgi:drug/metabolite transporter (DMT)-like permease
MYILAFLVKALLSTTFVIAQKALAIVSPVFLIGFRMTSAGLLLLGALALFNRKQLKLKQTDLLTFAKISFFHIYLAFIAEFWGLQYISGPKVALLFNFGPFITAILSYFMLRERLIWQQILGLIISFFGFLLIIFEQVPTEQIAGDFFSISLPELAILVSATSSVYAWLTIQKLSTKNYSTVFINGMGMLGGGLLALLTVPLFETYPSLNLPEIGQLSLWVGLLILISNIFCYNMYAWLLKRYSATFLSITGLTIPVFAALWEWLFLGKTMSLNFYCALIVISTGLLLFYLGESKRLARLTAQISESVG